MTGRVRRRSRLQLGALGAVLALLATISVTAATPVAASTSPSSAWSRALPFDHIRDSLVDDEGRILVTGDDRLLVLAPDGTELARIDGLWGAGPMDLHGGDVVVGLTTAGSVGLIDLDTLTTTGTLTIGAPVHPGGIVAFDDAIWFRTGLDMKALGRYDLITGAVSTLADVGSITRIHRIPGDDTAILVSGTSQPVRRVSTTSPFAVTASWATAYQLDHIAISGDGSTVLAPAADRTFTELDATTLAPTGRVITTPYETETATWSETRGGTLSSGALNRTFVNGIDSGVLTHDLPHPSTDVFETRISDDGNWVISTLAYDTTAGGHGRCACRVVVSPMATSLSGTTPSSVVAGVPTAVTLAGSGLGTTTSVTVGGIAAAPTSVEARSLVIEVPTSLAPGPVTVEAITPFGTASTTLTVVANTGATLSGTVRTSSAGLSGVALSIDGTALAEPLTTVTSATGQYVIGGLPLGEDYILTVEAPGRPTQRIGPLAARPNDVGTLNVWVGTPTSSSPPNLTTRLPGPAADLVVDPSTGRVVVAGQSGDLTVFDPEGHPLRRIPGLGGLGSLDLVDGEIHVVSTTRREVLRLDVSTLEITGRWPLPVAVNGSLAVADGRVWAGRGAPGATRELVALDTTTGTTEIISLASLSPLPPALLTLRSVPGRPELLLVTSSGTTTGVWVLDVSTPAPTLLAHTAATPPVAADGTAGLLWGRTGVEYDLDSLTPTGMDYATLSPAGAPAVAPTFSPTRGGTLAFGHTVSLRGDPDSTHALATARNRVGFDSTGDRVYQVTDTPALSVISLGPSMPGPVGPLQPVAQSVTMSAHGGGGATEMRVDGSPVPITATTASSITFSLPALPLGSHQLQYVTPWGTSPSRSFFVSAPPVIPTITAVSSPVVPSAGGQVTITGAKFTGATQVRAGTISASSFSVVSDGEILATFGPRAGGTSGNLRVTVGQSTSTNGPLLTWVAPLPSVTGLSPDHGGLLGGEQVTVSGQGLLFATAVRFGSTTVPFTVVGDTSIVATAPVGATAGPVDVTVTTAGGTSTGGASATYTYIPVPPTVASVSPSSGPPSGGTAVAITGDRFVDVTSVRFGATEAPAFSIDSRGLLIAVTPPGAPGTVSITITSREGTSEATSASAFTYVPPVPGVVTGVVRNVFAPLEGMIVILSRSDHLTVEAYTTTDADGRYRFEGVAPGEYTILTLDPSVFLGATSTYVAELYDDTPASLEDVSAATTFTVSSGATTTLQPIELEHNRPARLGGRVTDDGGVPLAGILVVLSDPDEPGILDYAITAADGTWALDDIPPGPYKVATIDPRLLFGVAPIWKSEVYDDGLTWEAGTVLVLGPGDDRSLGTVDLAPAE